MALARVVSFEGVTKGRIEQLRQEMSGGPPEDLPANPVRLTMVDGEAVYRG